MRMALFGVKERTKLGTRIWVVSLKSGEFHLLAKRLMELTRGKVQITRTGRLLRESGASSRSVQSGQKDFARRKTNGSRKQFIKTVSLKCAMVICLFLVQTPTNW